MMHYSEDVQKLFEIYEKYSSCVKCTFFVFNALMLGMIIAFIITGAKFVGLNVFNLG